MQTFMILCMVAIAVAAPQYTYQQPGVSNFGQGSGGLVQGSNGFGQGGGGLGQASNGFGQASNGFGQGAGGLGQASNGFGQGFGTQPSGQLIQHSAPIETIYNKQFFIHSAPEDDALDGSGSSNDNTILKKNLRVVIVKAPENKGLSNAALQLAKTASEDKTVVYVLTKQADLAELQNNLAQIQATNPNKPEVHFVKYKTPEEAEHAQHSIQSQYDNFGGPTQVLNEGFAPVENFIGSLGGSPFVTAGSLNNGLVANGNYGTVSNTYLPASKV